MESGAVLFLSAINCLAPKGVLVSFVSGVYFAHLKGQLKLKATVFKAVVSVVRVGDCQKNFVIK